MKKMIGLILAGTMLCFPACSAQENGTESVGTTAPEATTAAATPEATAVTATAELPKELKDTIESNDFEGVIYAVRDGETIVSYADGKLENGSAFVMLGIGLAAVSISLLNNKSE